MSVIVNTHPFYSLDYGGTVFGIRTSESVTINDLLALWKNAVSKRVVDFPPILKVPLPELHIQSHH